MGGGQQGGAITDRNQRDHWGIIRPLGALGGGPVELAPPHQEMQLKHSH
jgi:hypothetical protein